VSAPGDGLTPAAPHADFDRERRRRTRARAAAWLRRGDDDAGDLLSFEDVVAAFGMRGAVDRGVETIPLDSIVGTAGRGTREFDRAFRPATGRLRRRWGRVAAARGRGVALPPIDVYRIGALHFVEDGHHRVSVARALGDVAIDAHVREVRTALPLPEDVTAEELGLRHHERVFHERVPLPPAARERIRLSSPWRYAQLAALVEARGFRQSEAEGRLLSRPELARRWYDEQYEPTVQRLREAGAGGEGTDADRYLRFTMLRFLLLFTHEWSPEVVERLVGEIRPPRRGDDTLTHQLLDELD
jgi:hypothetical protein